MRAASLDWEGSAGNGRYDIYSLKAKWQKRIAAVALKRAAPAGMAKTKKAALRLIGIRKAGVAKSIM